jgi:nucleoside-diphosphate-sugar epimerase
LSKNLWRYRPVVATRETILVLGRDALAGDVVRTLVASDSNRRVVVARTTAGESPGERRIDPSSPTAARELADLLAELSPALVVLLAFSQSPVSPPEPWSSDSALADVLVSALDRHLEHGGRAPALLLLSSTVVYGTSVWSPVVFDERSFLPRETVFDSAHARWAETLRTVERAVVTWAVTHEARVGVLRAASVLGGPMDSPIGALLEASLPVRVLGYDPPCQVIHYDDLVEAIALAIDRGCGEVLNLVGRSVVPLSRVFAAAGVLAAPLPGPIAERLAPAGMDADHLRWPVLADGRRAAALLGFRPQRSLEDCLSGTR